MELAEVYATTRRSLLALADTIDDEAAATPVPALPRWTVKDTYAHLSGAARDVVGGRLENAGSPEWTARQVADRADDALAAICDEWAEHGPALEAAIRVADGPRMSFIVFDVWCHEHDVFGALGRRGDRSDARLADLAPLALAVFDRRFRKDNVPALRVARKVGDTVIGAGEPKAVLVTDDYELLRLLFGRRTAAQIAAAGWEGDMAPYLDHIHLFDLPAADLLD